MADGQTRRGQNVAGSIGITRDDHAELFDSSKKRSTRLSVLSVSRSRDLGDFRLDFDGMTAVAPAVPVRSRVASVS